MIEHDLLRATGELLPGIHAAAEAIEAQRKIPQNLIDQISDAGLFAAAVPAEFGGPEIDPLTMFDALENIAAADASTAWVILIIAANPYLFGNSLHEHVWRAMFASDVNTRTAGTLMPGGKALRVDNGYLVSGHWRYGSGAEHCEYLLSGCMVYEGDSLCRHDNGEPMLRWMIHRTDECELLLDSWDATGLRGSSSHDYVAKDMFVAEDWSFVVGETVHELANPLYRFPTMPFCHLSAVALGMAQASVNLVRQLATTKRRGPTLMCEDPSVQLRVAEAEALTAAARTFVKDVVGDIISTLQQGGEPGTDQRARFRLACTYAVDSATRAVNMMYKVAGGTAVYKPSQLDRILRDMHTAGTHVRFGDLSYIQAGRMLLGLDPGDPLF